MAKWKDSYEKDREKSAALGNSRWQELKLKCITSNGTPVAEDAKIAKIRFLTDASDAESIWVHKLPRRSRLGKPFSIDVYCMAQEDEKCEFCGSPDKDVYNAKRKILFWVYVYYILHVRQDADKKWEKFEYLGDNYFKEPVNEIRLLYVGPGFNNSIENKFLQWDKRFKTLCDRDYDWTREGFSMSDTSYDLIPDADGKSDESDEVKEAKANMIPMSEVIDSLKPGADDDRKTGGSSGEASEEPPTEDLEEQIDELFGEEDLPF